MLVEDGLEISKEEGAKVKSVIQRGNALDAPVWKGESILVRKWKI